MCVFCINTAVRIARIFVYFSYNSHTYKVHSKTFCAWYKSQFPNEKTFSWCLVVFQKRKGISMFGTANTSARFVHWTTYWKRAWFGFTSCSLKVDNLLAAQSWKTPRFPLPEYIIFCEIYASVSVCGKWERIHLSFKMPLKFLTESGCDVRCHFWWSGASHLTAG